MTPAAIRKRDQRARAAAGQVHRVTVWLDDGEAEIICSRGLRSETQADTVRRLIRECDRFGVAARQTPTNRP